MAFTAFQSWSSMLNWKLSWEETVLWAGACRHSQLRCVDVNTARSEHWLYARLVQAWVNTKAMEGLRIRFQELQPARVCQVPSADCISHLGRVFYVLSLFIYRPIFPDATFNCQCSWQQEYCIVYIRHFVFNIFMQVGNTTGARWTTGEILSPPMSFKIVCISVWSWYGVSLWCFFMPNSLQPFIRVLLVGEVRD